MRVVTLLIQCINLYCVVTDRFGQIKQDTELVTGNEQTINVYIRVEKRANYSYYICLLAFTFSVN